MPLRGADPRIAGCPANSPPQGPYGPPGPRIPTTGRGGRTMSPRAGVGGPGRSRVHPSRGVAQPTPTPARRTRGGNVGLSEWAWAAVTGVSAGVAWVCAWRARRWARVAVAAELRARVASSGAYMSAVNARAYCASAWVAAGVDEEAQGPDRVEPVGRLRAGSPAHPCRRMPTRGCPLSYAGPCGDRPCARFESEDEAPWMADMNGTTCEQITGELSTPKG